MAGKRTFMVVTEERTTRYYQVEASSAHEAAMIAGAGIATGELEPTQSNTVRLQAPQPKPLVDDSGHGRPATVAEVSDALKAQGPAVREALDAPHALKHTSGGRLG